MRSSPILVLSQEPLIAALVGFLVELAGFTPAFAEVDERLEDSLHRVRPILVALIDADLDAVRSDLFLAAVARRQIPLTLFAAPDRTVDSLPESAIERGVPWFRVPTDADRLMEIITLAVRTEWWQTLSVRRAPLASRREPPQRVREGAAAFVDRSGKRWFVFDRRGGERRQPPAGDDVSNDLPVARDGLSRGMRATVRRFVNDDGEIRECVLTSTELARGPGSLEAQLVRALQAET